VRTSARPTRLDLSTDEKFIAVHTPGSVRFHLVASPDNHIAEVKLDGKLRSVAFCGNGLFACVVGNRAVCWHVGKSAAVAGVWGVAPVDVDVKLKGSASCVVWKKHSDCWLLLVGCSEGSFCLAKYSLEGPKGQIRAVSQQPQSPFDKPGRFVRALLPLGDDRMLAVYASALR